MAVDAKKKWGEVAIKHDELNGELLQVGGDTTTDALDALSLPEKAQDLKAAVAEVKKAIAVMQGTIGKFSIK